METTKEGQAVAQEPPGDLISLGTAARILGCDVSTVFRWVHRTGKLRAWLRGGERYVVSRADVLALLEPVVPRAPEEPVPRRRRKRPAETAQDQLRRMGYAV